MAREYVALTEIAREFDLKKLNQALAEDIKITSSDLNRLGLPLMGYLNNFANERVQIVGNVEWGVIQTLDSNVLRERVEKIMNLSIPCIVFARSLEVDSVFLELGDKAGVPIYSTVKSTTNFIADLLKYIDSKLAKATNVHGVLLDIGGIGTLIMGKSGVGKSEIALELVKRGHRFVADDAIEITKLSDDTLLGCSPELIKNLLEIRGIGIVDMSKLYGIGSVRDNMNIDLIIQLEEWNQKNDYDRLGSAENYHYILEKPVPVITLPVSPGRNLAVILEAAVRNFALKKMGYDALEELEQRLQARNNIQNN